MKAPLFVKYFAAQGRMQVSPQSEDFGAFIITQSLRPFFRHNFRKSMTACSIHRFSENSNFYRIRIFPSVGLRWRERRCLVGPLYVTQAANTISSFHVFC